MVANCLNSGKTTQMAAPASNACVAKDKVVGSAESPISYQDENSARYIKGLSRSINDLALQKAIDGTLIDDDLLRLH
jgi:hypothetical protein